VLSEEYAPVLSEPTTVCLSLTVPGSQRTAEAQGRDLQQKSRPERHATPL